MRKRKLLLLMLLCSMLVACKKDAKTEKETVETQTAGVEVVEWKSFYEYSYEEQPEGTLLFSIEGNWSEKQSWVLQEQKEAVANVKELSQNKKAVEYEFSPKKEAGGYSDFEIYLYDEEIKETIYSYRISVMLSEDGERLSVMNVYFGNNFGEDTTEEGTPEEDTTEEGTPEEDTTEEGTPEEDTTEGSTGEQLDIQAAKEDFHKLVGELSFPKEFTSLYQEVQTYEIHEEEIPVGVVSFIYKENHYSCMVTPDITLADLKETFEIGEEQWETRIIHGIEVNFYQEQDSRFMMWENSGGNRYLMIEKKVIGEEGFEVAERLMKQ